MKDLSNHLPELKELLLKGNKILDNSTPSPQSQDLEDKLQDIKAQWEELNKTANQRGQKIDASVKHAQSFEDQLEKQLLWLQIAGDRLKGTTPKSLDKEVIARKLKDAQVKIVLYGVN